MAGSSQFDIVARLQLRAEQFSSEAGARFTQMSTMSKAAAKDIRDSFGQSFAEVQKLAEQSLKLPRTTSGSLDLSGEITSLRAAAAASDQKAAVARELSAAMLAASSSSRTVTESMRLEADAAMVAARAEEADAGAIRQRILALEAVQVQLNKTASATLNHTRAANDNIVSAGQQRQSSIMLGQQLQDFSVQVVSGQSVATAFAQQIGQASFALQGMGGKLAGVAAFLTTPWGIAATIGLTLFAPLVAKILEGNDALDDAVDKMKKDAEQTKVTAKAHDIFAKSIEGQIDAQRKLNEELTKGLQTQQQIEQGKLGEARKSLDDQTKSRPAAVKELQAAQQRLAEIKRQINNPVLGSDGSEGMGLNLAAVQAEKRVAKAKEALKALNASIATAQSSIRMAEIPLAEREVADSLDAGKAATDRYTEALGRLRKERAAGKITAEQFRASLKAETMARDRDLEAERKRKSDANRKPTRDPELATPAVISKLLRDTIGARITSTTGGKHVSNSDHYRSAAIDFVPKGGMASMTKADIREIFEKAGVAIRRNAGGVEQLFGPGDKGHSDHFHVAWEKGKLAVDNYRASLKDTAKAEREAAAEQKQLETALDQILGKFDPAADAARKYREELEEIDKLAKAGKITPDQQVAYVRNAKSDYSAAQTANAANNFRIIMGPEEVDGAIDAWQAGIAAAGEQMRDDAEAAGIVFTDQVRDGLAGAADLLGIRINGPARALLSPGGIEKPAGDAAKSLIDGLRNSPLKINTESLDRLEKGIGSALTGASYGQLGGSAFASITGGKQNQLGSAVGGALGKVAGDALGKTVATAVGGTLGKTLGSAAGPLGAIAGGIVGSVIGGLFKKTTQASSTLTFGSDGLAGGTAKGNGTAEKAAASASANSVVGSLNRIAESLGGTVTGAGSVSIGYRPGHKDGAYRVDTTGQGKLTGVLAFATEEEAVRAAIADALSDGVIGGISAASKRILAAGGDLEKALSKALMIEAVPKDLKAMLDPVGAAIDELNAKFQKTVDALKEGGASAEQMAQAQQLYGLQLAQVKNSTASASATLKEFVASLKIGSSSPYSLRDQEQAAKAALQPFLAQISAGQSIDQGKYQSAAQAFLDIERQLYGSTQAYFDQLDAVQAATNKAISTIDNATPIGGSVDSPFVKATAESAAATAAAVKTANEMAQDTNALLARLVAAAETNGGYINASDFIGTQRAFA
ncbi:hypothetical protein U1737_04785 [Sphingomonas sp. LB3N6]|uniref:hypothetical protein n=1 Tax=Sphingomonas fucosidasi TaxID=3096164 RepID=UPI002FC8D0F3